MQEQLDLVAEAKATGGVPRRGHFGLVLAGSTPSEDVVIAVGVTVGVTGDDPRFSHARGVGLGNTNLEEGVAGLDVVSITVVRTLWPDLYTLVTTLLIRASRYRDTCASPPYQTVAEDETSTGQLEVSPLASHSQQSPCRRRS